MWEAPGGVARREFASITPRTIDGQHQPNPLKRDNRLPDEEDRRQLQLDEMDWPRPVLPECRGDEHNHDAERGPEADVGDDHRAAERAYLADPAVRDDERQLERDERCDGRRRRHERRDDRLGILRDEDGVADAVEPLAGHETRLDREVPRAADRHPPDVGVGHLAAVGHHLAHLHQLQHADRREDGRHDEPHGRDHKACLEIHARHVEHRGPHHRLQEGDGRHVYTHAWRSSQVVRRAQVAVGMRLLTDNAPVDGGGA